MRNKVDWADLAIAGLMLTIFFYCVWMMFDYANLA